MKNKKIIDISLPIYEGMAVYPGTAETKITPTKSPGGNTLSEITISSHVATHIDAPFHSIDGAPTIDKLDLNLFYGLCRVLDLSNIEKEITVDTLKGKNIKAGERILLKTRNSKRGFSRFHVDFVYLSPSAADYLAKKRVLLVGIDSLSIKQRGSKDNTPHTALLSKGIPIVEGLNLLDVEEGNYTLSVFPLKFIGIDGSPARAVLFPA